MDDVTTLDPERRLVHEKQHGSLQGQTQVKRHLQSSPQPI